MNHLRQLKTKRKKICYPNPKIPLFNYEVPTFSSSYNLKLTFCCVLIGQCLMFPKWFNSPRTCTPIKDKAKSWACSCHVDNIPVINLSEFEIGSTCLKYGLHHLFIHKNRFIKLDLGVELQSSASSVDAFAPQESKEEFHQFLRNTTYEFSNNVYSTRDTTYHKTKLIRDNKDIIILSGDKDSGNHYEQKGSQ